MHISIMKAMFLVIKLLLENLNTIVESKCYFMEKDLKYLNSWNLQLAEKLAFLLMLL